MTKQHQDRFFVHFKLGGIFEVAIDLIRLNNDLRYFPRKGKLKQIEHEMIKRDRIFLESEYQKYDESAISAPTSSLLTEIELYFNSLTVQETKLAYLRSLITFFKDYSDIIHHDLYFSKAHADTLKSYRESKAFWEKTDNKEEAEKQLDAINEFLEIEYPNKEKRAKLISDFFWSLSSDKFSDSEFQSIEYKVYRHLSSSIHMFANRLDAFCLMSGIDFMQLQNECNVYLKNTRYITDVDYYLGSIELAKMYIDNLPRLEKKTFKEEPKVLEPKLSLTQIALKHVYESSQITRANGNQIATSYGHNSGEKLFQKYTLYSNVVNRTAKPYPYTVKKLNNRIELLNSVIPYVEETKVQKIKHEISVLKSLFDEDF